MREQECGGDGQGLKATGDLTHKDPAVPISALPTW